MSNRTPDDDLAQWDAAYLLGALSTDEQRTYENYLVANPERAAELTELSALPDMLNALSPEEAIALTDLAGGPADAGRPDNVTSLARAAAKRQRRSRRAMLAGAVASAAALLIIGGVVGASMFPRSSVSTVAMAPMQPGPREGLTAQLAVTQKQWGTELHWSCEYLKDWARDVDSYDIVVTTEDGEQAVVGSWRPAGDEAAGLAAATSIPTPQIRTIDIRVSGTDDPLAVTTL